MKKPLANVNPGPSRSKYPEQSEKMLVYVAIGALLLGALYTFFIYDYMHDDNPDGKSIMVIWVCGPLYLAALIWGINRAFIPKPVIQLKPVIFPGAILADRRI